MKFGVVVFPGSNCDRDMIDALSKDLGYEVIAHGWSFAKEFTVYQLQLPATAVGGYSGPIYYYWAILLIGCFPASAFLFTYLQGKKKTIYATPAAIETKDFKVWMWVLFWVALLLFSIMQTSTVHYFSLCYLPLSFLAAWQVYRFSERKQRLHGWSIAVLLFLGILLGLAITLLPLAGVYREMLTPYIGRQFAVTGLKTGVPWSVAETAYGIGYMILVIISGALLMYFALHRKLPAQLDDLKPLAEGDAPLNFTSPRSGKPYLYTPNGIILQDLNQRMIVYDPAPGPYGYREAITIDEPIVGQPLVAKVVAVPESFFLLRPPR